MYGVPLSYISWSTVWYVLGGSLCPGKKTVESRRRIVRIVHANRHAFWCLWRYRKASHIWFWSWEVIGIFLCKKHELNINISKWWPWLVKSLKFPNSPVPVPSRSQVQNRTQATVVSWHAACQQTVPISEHLMWVMGIKIHCRLSICVIKTWGEAWSILNPSPLSHLFANRAPLEEPMKPCRFPPHGGMMEEIYWKMDPRPSVFASHDWVTGSTLSPFTNHFAADSSGTNKSTNQLILPRFLFNTPQSNRKTWMTGTKAPWGHRPCEASEVVPI